MSGGGATHGGASADMVAHLKNSHSLILVGKDAQSPAPQEWDSATSSVYLSGDYADNPSVLRYILEKGITDAGGNPFDGVSAYDPSDDLSVMQDEVSTFLDSVRELDPVEDVSNWISTNRDNANELPVIDIEGSVRNIVTQSRLYASSTVSDAIMAAAASSEQIINKSRTGYVKRIRREHLNSVGSFVSAMSDVLAINTSAFAIGLAKLQRGTEDRMAMLDSEMLLPLNQTGIASFIDAFKSIALQQIDVMARVRLTESQQREQHVLQATNFILEQQRLRIGGEQSGVEIQRQVSASNIVAYTDEMQTNLDVDIKSQNWDLELFQQAGNIMSAVSGSVVPHAGKPSRVASAMSGALGGASVGMGAAAIPGVGTGVAIGAALVGGAMGAIAGYNE